MTTTNDLVAAAVERSLRNTWMRDYPANPAYASLEDAELKRLSRKYPRTVNNCSDEDKADIAALYRETITRWHADKIHGEQEERRTWEALVAAGHWPNGGAIPAIGAHVACIHAGLFGLPIRITGRVYKAKVGRRVRFDAGQPISGGSSEPLNQSHLVIE